MDGVKCNGAIIKGFVVRELVIQILVGILGGKLEKQVGGILPGVIDISNIFFQKFQRQPIDFNIC